MREYQYNIMAMKSSLSRLGPMCIETLEKVLKDRKTSGGVKARAALTILKLVGLDDVPHTRAAAKAAEDAEESVKRVFNSVYDELQKTRETYVVDAEDVEVVDEGRATAAD